VLLVLIAPIFTRGFQIGRYYRNVPIIILVVLSVFLIVNYPIFIEPANFFEGLTLQARHAVEGHVLHIDPLTHLFSYHLINSIAPGISWPLTLLALAGFLWMAFRWRKLTSLDRIFFLYFIFFYMAHEMSPLKAYPDYARYMIPTIPALFYFVAFLLRELMAIGPRSIALSISFATALIFISFALVDSFKLAHYLNKDTREEAAAIVQASGKKAFSERYGIIKTHIPILADIDLSKARESGIQVLVASSLTYGRFFLEDEKDRRRASYPVRKARYKELFSFPFTEIRPAYRTYAFSNPVIRIIDISSDAR
ncbi:MAG: hypothetical protein JRJ60_21510, partial [Deltaproteobacteria bacterium]|nr:hypothetical protein [Deltaproteobacteria bacterium]